MRTLAPPIQNALRHAVMHVVRLNYLLHTIPHQNFSKITWVAEKKGAGRAAAILRSQEIFRQFTSVYHTDGLMFFKLILGHEFIVQATTEIAKHGVRIRRRNMNIHRDQRIIKQFN